MGKLAREMVERELARLEQRLESERPDFGG
jgi:hypothetical protein